MPGVTRGRSTEKKVRPVPAPSTKAASSSSGGTPAKELRMTKTPKGRFTVV